MQMVLPGRGQADGNRGQRAAGAVRDEKRARGFEGKGRWRFVCLGLSEFKLFYEYLQETEIDSISEGL